MDQVLEAAEVLNQGGLVIFPTDTAFGIGCRIDKPKSIERLFHIRKRPESLPTPILVDSLQMAKKYWHSPLPNIVRRMAKKYWPGGLTIVYKAKTDTTPPLVRGGGPNIGLRVPNHEVVLDIIRTLGVPILGPSANYHREKTPYTFKDINPDLLKLVDYIIPGECQTKMSSTVIDCTVKPSKVIRQGAVKIF